MPENQKYSPSLEDTLYKIFTNVNEWLRFAETKNGALVAFNTAALAGSLALLPSSGTGASKIVLIIGIVLFSISVCIMIYSFIPITYKTFNYSKLSEEQFDKEKESLNAFFFGAICKITEKQLEKLVLMKINDSAESSGKLNMDICQQIVQNSEITMSKLRQFWWAGAISIAGILATIFSIIALSCNI